VALTARYRPEHPPSETASFGMDFSEILPPGMILVSATLAIFTNTVAPLPADADWSKQPVYIRGRAVYAILAGGLAGSDYQLVWTATDNRGGIWNRTALVLCAPTS
jgi:hypothetical protein